MDFVEIRLMKSVIIIASFCLSIYINENNLVSFIIHSCIPQPSDFLPCMLRNQLVNWGNAECIGRYKVFGNSKPKVRPFQYAAKELILFVYLLRWRCWGNDSSVLAYWDGSPKRRSRESNAAWQHQQRIWWLRKKEKEKRNRKQENEEKRHTNQHPKSDI